MPDLALRFGSQGIGTSAPNLLRTHEQHGGAINVIPVPI